MEALLIVAVIGWMAVGVNLLFTYDKAQSADVQHGH